MNALSNTTFFVATPCGDAYELLPRHEIVRQLTNRQMRWSQLLWCPNDQRWKPAREFQGLMGVLPTIAQSPANAAADSTTGETSVMTSVRVTPQQVIIDDHPRAETQPSVPVPSTEVLPVSAGTPRRIKVITTARVAVPKTRALGTDDAVRGASPMESYLAVTVRIFQIPLTMILTMFFTIYCMPLKMRAVLAECAESRRVFLWDAVETMIFNRVDPLVRSVTLRDELGATLSLNLSHPMRIRGILEFKTPLTKTVHLQVQVRCGNGARRVLMEHVLEIPAGTKSVTVFSTVAPKGEFYWTGTCQDGAPDQPVPATLTVAMDY